MTMAKTRFSQVKSPLPYSFTSMLQSSILATTPRKLPHIAIGGMHSVMIIIINEYSEPSSDDE